MKREGVELEIRQNLPIKKIRLNSFLNKDVNSTLRTKSNVDAKTTIRIKIAKLELQKAKNNSGSGSGSVYPLSAKCLTCSLWACVSLPNHSWARPRKLFLLSQSLHSKPLFSTALRPQFAPCPAFLFLLLYE